MAGHHSLGAAASGRCCGTSRGGGSRWCCARSGRRRGGSRSVMRTWGGTRSSAGRGWSGCAESAACVLPARQGCRRGVAGAGRDAAAAARRLPGGVRDPADGGGFVHRPGGARGTVYKACGFTAAGQTAVRRSRGAAHYTVTAAEDVLAARAGAGRRGGAEGRVRRAGAGRAAAPDFNQLKTDGDGGLLATLAGSATTASRRGSGTAWQRSWRWWFSPAVGRGLGLRRRPVAQTMPQEALRRCGIRYNTRLRRHIAPASRRSNGRSAPSMPRPLMSSCAPGCAPRPPPAAELAAHRHRRQDRPRALRPDGTQPHLLSAYDVTEGTVLGQADVNGNQRDHLLRSPPGSNPHHPATPATATATTAAAAAGKGKGSWSS